MKLKLLDKTALFDIKCSPEVLKKTEIPGFPPIPKTPNTRSGLNGKEIFWVGNNNFLLRTNLTDEILWQKTLIKLEQKGLLTQTMVSDIYNFFEFSGEGVEEYLASITSLDLEVLSNSSACFSQALGLHTLFIKRGWGFELAFENSYLEMVKDQFKPYF